MTVLEAHVALVDRLNAGSTAGARRDHDERRAKQHDEPEARHGRHSLPAFCRPGKPPIPNRVQAIAKGGCYGRIVFTGLVEATGRLEACSRSGPGFRMSVSTRLGPLELGESIAVNGACLTVVHAPAGGFQADVSAETARLTTLGRLKTGAVLNLERSLALGSRLGGHLVTGHVDGISRVSEVDESGQALRVAFEAPAELLRFIALKGSVALDGVSLTVNAVRPRGFEVMLIPHTLAVTNLDGLRPERELNLEVDLIARYVARYLDTAEKRPGDVPEREDGLTDALKRAGIL